MFRVVCMKHLCQLGGVLELETVKVEDVLDTRYASGKRAGGEYGFEASGMYCPRLSILETQAHLGNEDVAADCIDRWYVIDEAGLPVYMSVRDEDKAAFASVDPFKTWRVNLNIAEV